MIRNALDDVRQRNPPFQIRRQHVPPRIGRRLKADASDPGACQSEFDDRSQLIVVDSSLQRRNQRDVDAGLSKRFERRQLRLQQRLAAQCAINIIIQPVELKINLNPIAVPRHQLHERWVAGEADAIRVDHHIVDRARQSIRNDFRKLRMRRRLAPGKLANLCAAFDLDQPIDLPLAVGKGKVFPARTAAGIAHWTGEVARRGDFQHADARVLLMLGTQAAVQRAALVRLDAENGGHLRRQREFHPVVPTDVRANEIFALAVFLARFAKINPPAANDDLSRHDGQTLGTEALRRSQKRIVPVAHNDGVGSQLRQTYFHIEATLSQLTPFSFPRKAQSINSMR